MIKCDFDYYGISVEQGFARIESITIGNGNLLDSPDSDKSCEAYYHLYTSEMVKLPSVERVTLTISGNENPFDAAYDEISTKYRNVTTV